MTADNVELSGFDRSDVLVMQLGEDMESCEIKILSDDIMTTYHDCGKPVKYAVSYKGVRGERIAEKLCGTHFRALEKRIASVKKRTGYDAQLVSEQIA